MSVVERTPIDDFLASQADLTAVERFARKHDADLIPHQEVYYRDLLPATAPGPGQQFGFEVNLDRCTGCKSCVTACHNMNGLDDDEAWRRVSVLHGGTSESPYQQTVTAACHHCVDPACQSACPVDAYDKDPITGIVIHLDDQCIGCSYCTLACPYEVPQYSHDRGIVRKCDMCRDRLADGEAPACVQACPNEAIRIAVVDVDALVAEVVAGSRVPGEPPSSITLPTTRYLTSREVPQLDVVDIRGVEPALAHTPLAIMLVLTQMSVGAFIINLSIGLFGPRAMASALRPYGAAVALVTGLVALAASVLHLGRPRLAYRALIGLRHSWLSREVLAFGMFAALAALHAADLLLGQPAGETASLILATSVALSGIAGVACSVLIYGTTHRTAWRPAILAPSFAASGLVTGGATMLWTAMVTAVALDGGRTRSDVVALVRALAVGLLITSIVRLIVATATFPRARHSENADERRTRLLVSGVLRPMVVYRFALVGVGGLGMPVVLAFIDISNLPRAIAGSVAATVSVLALIGAELLERSLFFRTASTPRLSGSHRS